RPAVPPDVASALCLGLAAPPAGARQTEAGTSAEAEIQIQLNHSKEEYHMMESVKAEAETISLDGIGIITASGTWPGHGWGDENHEIGRASCRERGGGEGAGA